MAGRRAKEPVEPGERRLAVDFANLAFRVYHAWPPERRLTNAAGEDVTVPHGVVTGILALAREVSATHVSIAFESRAPLRRDAIDPDYKAGRRPADGELIEGLGRAAILLAATGWHLADYPGEEADDVLASIARQTAERGGRAFIATADRDLVGAVAPAVTLLDTRRGMRHLERIDEAFVRATWGIEPRRWAERKALAGDGSDGYRGCPGVGPKGAAALLAAYPSLEALRGSLDGVEPARARNALRAGWEGVERSYALALLRDDLPIACPPEAGPLAGARHAAAQFAAAGLPALATRLAKL